MKTFSLRSGTVPVVFLLLPLLVCCCSIRRHSWFRLDAVSNTIDEALPGGDSLVDISVRTDINTLDRPTVYLSIGRRGSRMIRIESLEVALVYSPGPQARHLSLDGIYGSYYSRVKGGDSTWSDISFERFPEQFRRLDTNRREKGLCYQYTFDAIAREAEEIFLRFAAEISVGEERVVVRRVVRLTRESKLDFCFGRCC